MKNITSKLVMYSLIVIIAMGGATSCKSKKKLARERAAAEYAAKASQAKKDLLAIINGDTDWTLEQKKARLEAIKAENFKEQEILDLISQAEEKIKEQERILEEEKLKELEKEKHKEVTEKYSAVVNKLKSIAGSPNYETANRMIKGAMNMFAAPDIPVLIIISKAGGFNDYDKPTTISKFLDYLKDVKSFNYNIESVKYNELGKITELELIKK